MKRVVILTGSELRHQYFYNSMINDTRFEVIAVFSEGDELSLMNRTLNKEHSALEIEHAKLRAETEEAYFKDFVMSCPDSALVSSIKKGEINSDEVFNSLKLINPDLLICYGSSIVDARVVRYFKNKFLNVHLGLSPYYRGSGTNVWPIINNELDMIGATFMFIDEGIDTGKIIHQIRADINIDDNVHTIGNRLIIQMTRVYAEIIDKFDLLTEQPQPKSDGRLYLRKHFDAASCELLYRKFEQGIVKEYLSSSRTNLPYIVSNNGLSY